jgi:hypothetical protein
VTNGGHPATAATRLERRRSGGASRQFRHRRHLERAGVFLRGDDVVVRRASGVAIWAGFVSGRDLSRIPGRIPPRSPCGRGRPGSSETCARCAGGGFRRTSCNGSRPDPLGRVGTGLNLPHLPAAQPAPRGRPLQTGRELAGARLAETHVTVDFVDLEDDSVDAPSPATRSSVGSGRSAHDHGLLPAARSRRWR